MRVFDCHIHVQPWEQMRPDARALMTAGRPDLAEIQTALSDPGQLLRLMDREGVERAALINYVAPEVMGFVATANEWVARYVRGHEDRLVAVGSVHPRHEPDAAGQTRRLFEELGIRMIKIHPPHQLFAANAYRDGLGGLGAVYAEAERAGRPVMIHTGTSVFPGARNRFADPMAVDDVAVDYPRLKLILAHAGRPLYMETAVFLARRHPNVHLDLSGIPPRKLLEYLPRLEDLADKCLWGTDYPSPGVASMRRNVEAFLALPLSEAARERILWSNAAALIR
ncbi:MAG TPA: amidohydrolase family protein [Thermoanaerobaculia bacterium]|jgi:predicted TIM-barrel fold metal-dependent hydrolase|nr:amidohydrolase family protein [Thermoanaerobaculia bacterium]